MLQPFLWIKTRIQIINKDVAYYSFINAHRKYASISSDKNDFSEIFSVLYY